jgi:hypothetical protein
MNNFMKNDSYRAVKPLLDESGLPWTAKSGGSHIKIFVKEKLLLVLSRGSRTVGFRDIENCKRDIRRAVRELGVA